MTWFSRFYWSTFTRYGLKNVDSIITVSENTKQDVVDRYGVNDQKVTAIPLAIDDELSRSVSPDETREVLSRYSVEEPYLLYVGTIEPRKNIPRLIRAFDRAKIRYGFDHKLVIVGKKGWLFDDVFDIVQELGISDQVVFTGFVPDEDLPGLYGSADGFVFPSLYEGFGLPPLEAMSYGTPVIVANSSSLPEVVGDAGLLIDPKNVDDIADKIGRLATNENLRGELERKGMKRARTFSLDRLAKKTLEVYHETVE
jgi:glycosyltransferase involved in cell wall biosynthesis